MDALVLIPWPETTWSAADRIAGDTPMPLTEIGQQAAAGWAKEFSNLGVGVVYAGEEPTSSELAKILCKDCGARRKTDAGLNEVDAGLWEGLTSDELQRRYPKVFKRWRGDPSCMCPPEGEKWDVAMDRLAKAIERIVGKEAKGCVGLIVGPLAMTVTRCIIESADPETVVESDVSEPILYKRTGDEHLLTAAGSALGVGHAVADPNVRADSGTGESKI